MGAVGARVFKRGQRGLSEVGALEARVFKWGRKGIATSVQVA